MEIKVIEKSLSKREFEMVFVTPFASKTAKKRVAGRAVYEWSNANTRSRFSLAVNENWRNGREAGESRQKNKRELGGENGPGNGDFECEIRRKIGDLKLSKVKFPNRAEPKAKNENNFFQNEVEKSKASAGGFLNRGNSPDKGRKNVHLSKLSRAFSLALAKDTAAQFDLKPLKHLHRFIYKVFMGRRLDAGDFGLSGAERTIIGELLKKKKMVTGEDIQFRAEFFNSLTCPDRTKKKRGQPQVHFQQGDRAPQKSIQRLAIVRSGRGPRVGECRVLRALFRGRRLEQRHPDRVLLRLLDVQQDEEPADREEHFEALHQAHQAEPRFRGRNGAFPEHGL